MQKSSLVPTVQPAPTTPAPATAVRYTMLAATVRHEGSTLTIHLIATSRRSALGFADERLRLGTSLVLSVGGVELSARVGWCAGKRFRLDAELGDDGRLWAWLATAQHHPGSLPKVGANDAPAGEPAGADPEDARP